jgi:threonine aldolase
MQRPLNPSNMDTAGKRQFASDNYAGVCPEAWEAMSRANRGHTRAYGDDEWTQAATEQLRELFETDCEVFFVYGGTAANALTLACLCRSYHAVLCPATAHVETDECGAPEFFTHGAKVVQVPGTAGKLRPEEVEEAALRRTDVHFPKVKALSLTQATELGTVYTAAELAALGETARRLGLRLHLDGARFANALAALDVAPAELSWKAGVDVLCLGGTKNGLAYGEAVLFFDRRLAEEFDYRRKQAGQLASKMRFLAAGWVGLLDSGAWLRNARHANAAARRLEAGLREIAGVEVLFPCQANAVFLNLSSQVTRGLEQRGWRFYTFAGVGARLMCSWDTTDGDIAALVTDVRELMQAR